MIFYRKRHKRTAFAMFVIFLFAAAAVFVIIYIMDNVVFSAAEQISEDYAASCINGRIDELSKKIISEKNLDLFTINL